MRNIFLIILVVAISGCVAPKTGKHFVKPVSVADNMASIYVFRISKFAGSLYVARFMLNDEPMGKLGNGDYFVRHVPPGKYVIKIEKSIFELGPEHEVSLNVQAGQNYYIQYFVEPGDIIVTDSTAIGLTSDGMINVPEEAALTKLTGLSEVE